MWGHVGVTLLPHGSHGTHVVVTCGLCGKKCKRMWTFFFCPRNVCIGFFHLLFEINPQFVLDGGRCPWTRSAGSLWVVSFLWFLTVISGRITEELCSGAQRFRIKKSHQWFQQLHNTEATLSLIPLALKGGGSTICVPKGLAMRHSNSHLVLMTRIKVLQLQRDLRV